MQPPPEPKLALVEMVPSSLTIGYTAHDESFSYSTISPIGIEELQFSSDRQMIERYFLPLLAALRQRIQQTHPLPIS